MPLIIILYYSLCYEGEIIWLEGIHFEIILFFNKTSILLKKFDCFIYKTPFIEIKLQ